MEISSQRMYLCELFEGLYILRRKDGLLFITDKNYNMILYPWFDEIDICSNCYIVRKTINGE